VILIALVLLAGISVVICGGALGNLAQLRFTLPWTIGLALAIQILIISVFPTQVPPAVAQGLHLVSYGLAVLFLITNRHIPWLWLVGLGGLANLVAIGANAGVMPASPTALAGAGLTAARGKFQNSTTVSGAHLRFLGDVLWIPRGWPLANVFSIGDIILAVGVTLLLHSVCRSRLARVAHRPPPAHARRTRHLRPATSRP